MSACQFLDKWTTVELVVLFLEIFFEVIEVILVCLLCSSFGRQRLVGSCFKLFSE